mmetsp:Transcript_8820/g.30298  ORF Transcript_8820/g.30298 Transcript_8820/m.30298 type:complete len:277 (+) Transcript_8820:2223-3053(+)
MSGPRAAPAEPGKQAREDSSQDIWQAHEGELHECSGSGVGRQGCGRATRVGLREGDNAVRDGAHIASKRSKDLGQDPLEHGHERNVAQGALHVGEVSQRGHKLRLEDGEVVERGGPEVRDGFLQSRHRPRPDRPKIRQQRLPVTGKGKNVNGCAVAQVLDKLGVGRGLPVPAQVNQPRKRPSAPPAVPWIRLRPHGVHQGLDDEVKLGRQGCRSDGARRSLRPQPSRHQRGLRVKGVCEVDRAGEAVVRRTGPHRLRELREKRLEWQSQEPLLWLA